MGEYPSERPGAVTTVGVISIIVAAIFILMALSSFAGAALTKLMPSMAPAGNMPAGMENLQKMQEEAARYSIPLGLLQLAIAGLMLAGAIQLLRLKESGRKLLEGLNWFGVVYVAGMALYGIGMSSRMVAAFPNMGRPEAALPMMAGAMAGPLIFAVIQLVVIALLLWQLRTPAVREAMTA